MDLATWEWTCPCCGQRKRGIPGWAFGAPIQALWAEEGDTAFEIIEEDCDGCHACSKACPVDAIAGEIKELHVIDHEVCISCGACVDVCPTDAVRTFPKHELDKAEVV